MPTSLLGGKPRIYAHVALHGQTAGGSAVEAAGEEHAGPRSCAAFPSGKIPILDPRGEWWAPLPIWYLQTYHTHADKYTPCNQQTGEQYNATAPEARPGPHICYARRYHDSRLIP